MNVVSCCLMGCKKPSYGGGRCWPHLRELLKRMGWKTCEKCSDPAVAPDPIFGGEIALCPKHSEI